VSLRIRVIRDLGDKDGGEIFDPLLCSIDAAIARGSQEINANAPVNPVSLEVVYRAGIRVGQCVEVADGFYGSNWRGQIVAVNHVVSGPVAYSKLDIERAV